jgi:hypothetical protein
MTGELRERVAKLENQREQLRQALRSVLIAHSVIAPWAGDGDLDATNDGPLLLMVAEQFANAAPTSPDPGGQP